MRNPVEMPRAKPLLRRVTARNTSATEQALKRKRSLITAPWLVNEQFYDWFSDSFMNNEASSMLAYLKPV